MISQTDANSQLHLEMGAWEDVWPEVSAAPVLEWNEPRTRGKWPEAAFSLCHLQGAAGQITSPPRAPMTESAMRGSGTGRSPCDLCAEGTACGVIPCT